MTSGYRNSCRAKPLQQRVTMRDSSKSSVPEGENSADGLRHEPYLTKNPVTHPMKIDSTVIDNLCQSRVAGVSAEEKEQM